MKISVSDAIDRLRAGEVVALPTDTVYGLAVDFRRREAVEALFDLKGRADDKPLILLASDVHQIESFLVSVPPDFYDLADAHWPGALTLVMGADQGRIPERVRSHLPTCGFRIPSHPLALEVFKEMGPLAVTSANRSGGAAATNADEVEATFGMEFPVVDGGPCQVGVASTILAFEEHRWRVLRQGSVTFDPGSL